MSKDLRLELSGCLSHATFGQNCTGCAHSLNHGFQGGLVHGRQDTKDVGHSFKS
jgi:hypothetical protein